MVDRTRPVAKQRLKELSRNDWTQAQQRPVIHYVSSGRNLTVEIERSVFEARDDVAAIR